ncbi:MAG TPA: hypothetical protein VL171_16840 [Verrucomicrobiae bacterium]|nr:hypothetical protein [Verrucomicrobiae bacterium]
MRIVILLAILTMLSVAVVAAQPKMIVLGDGGSNHEIVYPNTIQPIRERTNYPSLHLTNSPMSGVTNSSIVLTNNSIVVTNRPGVTNSPHLMLPKP